MPELHENTELDARFIEQEHRFLRVLSNLYETRSLSSTDSRRRAAVRAAIWRMFSPSTVAVAGGSAVAIATLVVLIWQTDLIREQNKYFKEQNDKLQSQIDLQSQQGIVQRRTEVISSLYERDGEIPRANSRTRSEAVREFVALERVRLPKGERVNLEGALLEGVSLVGADLEQVRLWGCNLLNADLSNAKLSSVDFRGTLIGSAEHNPVQLSGTILVGADFEGVDLTGVPFARSDLRRARLNSVNLKGVLFLQTDLREAQLFGIKNWELVESMRGANIYGVKHAPDGFREWALSNGAVEISNNGEWSRSLESGRSSP